MCVCNLPVSLIVLFIFLCGGELVWASSVAQQAEITQVRKAVLQLSHQWLQLHKLGRRAENRMPRQGDSILQHYCVSKLIPSYSTPSPRSWLQSHLTSPGFHDYDNNTKHNCFGACSFRSSALPSGTTFLSPVLQMPILLPHFKYCLKTHFSNLFSLKVLDYIPSPLCTLSEF